MNFFNIPPLLAMAKQHCSGRENPHWFDQHLRPDFVLYKDEIPQVVIEAKKPNNIQTERNKEQLFSYMRQKKVDFGLYIGEEIQLYYDVLLMSSCRC